MRMSNRNKQPFWYSKQSGVVEDYNADGFQVGTHAEYEKPTKCCGNISPARGSVIAQEFGDDDQYDKVIALENRDTPIDEYTVLWIDSEPSLDSNGALTVNADGEIVTPWDYIVRKVGRGLPLFGGVLIAVSKVSVTGGHINGGVSA